MCGIVGIAGNTYPKDLKMFRDMLIFDQVRGFDSTGVMVVGPKSDTPIVEKELDGPDNLWVYGNSEIFDTKGISKLCNKVLLGHNRFATAGLITRENAHPFQFGHITGVHNGSLRVWYGLDYDENGKRFDVDSKAIYATLSDKGIDFTWENFIGAAALVWWDEKEGTLNFIRNDERPLFHAFNKEKNTIMWASEEWMIRVAAARNGVTLAQFDMETTTKEGVTHKYKQSIFSFPEDTLFRWKISNTKIELVEERKLEKKAPAASTTTSTGTTNGTVRSGVVGVVSSIEDKLPDDHKFKYLWASGLEKAPATLRGSVFTYERVIHMSDQGEYRPYFVGQLKEPFLGCTRVEIYPDTMADVREFLSENIQRGNSYEMCARPRMRKFQRGDNKPWGFRISLHQLKLHRGNDYSDLVDHLKKLEEGNSGPLTYRVSGQRLVPLVEWYDHVKKAGGCCAFCGSGIQLEGHKTMKWIDSQTMICAGCVEDGTWEQIGMQFAVN